MLVNIELLIEILDIVGPIRDKLERNENIIKILKRLNLDPEHPPADFAGVYAYALVEYGVGKPKPLLELFRQEEIKQTFRKAFDNNYPSILLSEVDAFIEAYALGDEIKSLRIDIRREIAVFAAVFIEVAKRTRTPAEILTNQEISSLHALITSIQERLDRLPTLEGIRAEMARLAAQNYLVLPPVDTQDAVDMRHAVETRHGTSLQENNRTFALAQQMRGWFETLDYRFEKYEVWEDNYFEWIIKIPVRRSRYDRILVMGIEGEAGLSDVMALRQSVAAQKTDEGWLVTARRISPAARSEVEKEENYHLNCYTFDELLDEDADFSRYLEWLEAEVKHRKIDKNYVPLGCRKEEFDSNTKCKIGVSCYDERDGWIDGYIDKWLDDPVKEHISILGEFGTGKTWVALHYAWIALQRYQEAQKRGVERPRLPLVITLRDYAKALNVENVLAGFFFTQHNIRINSEVFEQLNRMGKLLLIFDGFDEMAAKIDHQQMINNFWELAKVVVPGAKVILTCRTEHFPEATEGWALLNAELQASTANLTGETPQFEVLELEKFNDEQIRQVLSLQAEPATVDRVMNNVQLLDLARRPVMTELILEALPDIEAGKPVDMSRVYLYAVRRKMERDITHERTFTSLADKLYFLCELSWEMLSTDQMSLNYRLFPERIRRLFGIVVRKEKDLDHWHYDMMGQTMLIRNAEGDYTPAHRSLLEFFVAYKFAAELGVLAPDFIELAQAQVDDYLDRDAAPANYNWSSYFQRQVDEAGLIIKIPPLQKFCSESFEHLQQTFGQAPLTKAVLDLLAPMVDIKTPDSGIGMTCPYDILDATQGKTEAEVGYLGGNVATLLVKVDNAALEGKDFSHAVIKGADFSQASLQRVNFHGAYLLDCVFTRVFGRVYSVTFSPDSKFLATGDSQASVSLWDTASGSEYFSFKGHTDKVSSVAFSSDGQILASGSNDRTVKLWDIKTGQCRKTLQGHTDKVSSVAFSSDGQILASSSSDRTIKVWDTKTGQCQKTLQGHADSIRSVAFSSDSQILASSSSDRTIKLWDIKTGQCRKTLHEHIGRVRSVAFTPDGQTLASGASDCTVKLWDIQTGECHKTFQENIEWISSVAFSPDGQTLASGSDNHAIKLWDIPTGKCLKTLHGHTHWIHSVKFSPDGHTLASSSEDQTVKLWDVQTGECRKTLQGYMNWVHSVRLSPDDRILASGHTDQTVRIWDIKSGKCLKILRGHSFWIHSVKFSPDGQTIASAGADQAVKLWDIQSGECRKTFQGHVGWLDSVAFSPDGRTLASAGGDNTIKLWDIQSGECRKTLHGHSRHINSVALSPDGRTLASASGDNTVRLWEICSGECLLILQGHTDWVRSVAFSQDSQTLVSSSSDHTVKLWDLKTGECLKTLHGHTNKIHSVAFSPDSYTIASGSSDQTIKLWNVKTGECCKTIEGHERWVESVTFSSDGEILASSSADETIKLWDVKTGKCLKTLKSEKPYEAMNITGVKGITENQKANLKALGAIAEE